MSTPILPSTQIISTKPVVISAPGRGDDLQLRVSAPASGERLPVVVFSHGYGWSMDAYAPLVDYWTSQGLIVVQPTHLDSRSLAIAPNDPRTPDIWRIRVEDLTRTLDHLEQLDTSVPALAGRVDVSKIAVAGHSWGAQTASMLLGARVLDSQGQPGEIATDPRISAGVLLSLTGTGDELAPFAAQNFPFMRPDFTQLTTPSLLVAGDHDDSPLSSRGPDWFSDGYRLSPGVRHLLTVFGGEHSLGGISGYAVAETTDESPDRVGLVQRVTTAYVRTTLGVDDATFTDAATGLGIDSLGQLESK